MFEELQAKQPGQSLINLLLYELCSRSVHACTSAFYHTRAVNVERVPATGPLLIAANHQSYLDPPMIGSFILQRHLNFMARSSLFRSGPFAALIASLGAIPLRDDVGDAGAIREAIARLNEGRAMLIFPEGSRCEDGEIHEFKRGVSLLVKKAKCPVVPAAIEGAWHAWPIGQPIPKLIGQRVLVNYGHPIPHDELFQDGSDAAMARIKREVTALRDELRDLLVIERRA